MGLMGTTICIQDKPGESPRRITKITPYKDGGFAMLLPYHAAKKGYLMKMPMNYAYGNHTITRDEYIAYSAEDRVKLSIHPDGFVQFSGENRGKILSGRDSQTGEPKGLGIMSSPLTKPIMSGPTFGVSVWGLQDFEPFVNMGQRGIMIFGESDFYYRDSTCDTWNSYVVEGFVISNKYSWAIRESNGQLTARIFHPFFERTGATFDLRVMPLPNQPVYLGMMVSRLESHFQSPSGFCFGGPSDITLKHGLMALYPAPETINVDGSLDYV